MSEYTGPMSNKVFEYLDSFVRPPDPPFEEIGYQKLLENQKSNIGKECCQYAIALLSEPDSKKADKMERDFIATMKQKYPQHNWLPGRRGNR